MRGRLPLFSKKFNLLHTPFQSTPPCEGATTGNCRQSEKVFQSTPPCEGATRPYVDDDHIVFQSTPPCEGATYALGTGELLEVSIHAPL